MLDSGCLAASAFIQSNAKSAWQYEADLVSPLRMPPWYVAAISTLSHLLTAEKSTPPWSSASFPGRCIPFESDSARHLNTPYSLYKASSSTLVISSTSIDPRTARAAYSSRTDYTFDNWPIPHDSICEEWPSEHELPRTWDPRSRA